MALIAQALATTVLVFLRRRIGSRFLDTQAALAVLLIPGFGLFFQNDDLRPLMWFLGAYLLACFVVRGNSMRRHFLGQAEHSRSTGWPVLLSLPLLRRMSVEKATTVAEPMLVLAVGMLTLGASKPLGAFLMVAGFALIFSEGVRRGYEQQRLMDIRDAIIDQQRMAERFRRWR